MDLNNNHEVRLLGFRIQRTGTIILSYIALTLFIQFFSELYYQVQSLLYYIFNTPISEILANIGNFLQGMIGLLIPLTLESFLLAIFILCVIKQKSFRNEDIYAKWFSIRLTKSSISVLFILSLAFIIIDSLLFFNSLMSLMIITLHLPSLYLIYYLIFNIAAIISMVIQIYTLIICVKNRETLP
jgi:hypothetical protein